MRYFTAGSVFFLLTTAALASCKPTTRATPEPAPAAATTLVPCGDAGYVRGQLYGAIPVSLDWGGTDLDCEGMPRPSGKGARLRFASVAADGNLQLAIIIAIPDLERDAAGRELVSNVTVIEEGGGRFFSTSDLGNCLTDITVLEKLDVDADRYSIGGRLYCVSPLAEINGDSSVLIPELAFLGLVDWNSS